MLFFISYHFMFSCLSSLFSFALCTSVYIISNCHLAFLKPFDRFILFVIVLQLWIIEHWSWPSTHSFTFKVFLFYYLKTWACLTFNTKFLNYINELSNIWRSNHSIQEKHNIQMHQQKCTFKMKAMMSIIYSYFWLRMCINTHSYWCTTKKWIK